MFVPDDDGENSDEGSNSAHDLEIRNGANQDDYLPPLLRLERYVMSENVYNRQMVGRVALETLRAVADTPEDVRAAMDIINRAAFDTEISVRVELMEQLPHIAMVCHEERDRLHFVVQDYLLPLVIRLLGDSDNQVRKITQAALLVLMEQGLVEMRDVEQQVCPVILTLTEVDNLVECHTGAVALMSKMAPLLGAEATERLFMHRFAALCSDPVFYVRKVCANTFGDFCAVVGTAATEEFLLPYFVELCNDGIWGVRKACAEVFTTVALHCTLKTRKETLAPVFNNLLLDQSRWVRMSAFQALGQFIATFTNSHTSNVPHGELVHQQEDPRFNILASGVNNSISRSIGEEASSLLCNQPFHYSKGSLPIVCEGNRGGVTSMSCYICCMQNARISAVDSVNSVSLLNASCCTESSARNEKTDHDISSETSVNAVHNCDITSVNDLQCKNSSMRDLNISVENDTSQHFNTFQYWRLPIPELEFSNSSDESNSAVVLSRKKTNDVRRSICPRLQSDINAAINEELDYLASRLEQDFFMDEGQLESADMHISSNLTLSVEPDVQNIQSSGTDLPESTGNNTEDKMEAGSKPLDSQDYDESNASQEEPSTSHKPTVSYSECSTSEECSVTHEEFISSCEQPSISPQEPRTSQEPKASEEPIMSYERPSTSYEQPNMSYEQPCTLYDHPIASYEQSSTLDEQPSALYEESSAQYEQPSASRDATIAHQEIKVHHESGSYNSDGKSSVSFCEEKQNSSHYEQRMFAVCSKQKPSPLYHKSKLSSSCNDQKTPYPSISYQEQKPATIYQEQRLHMSYQEQRSSSVSYQEQRPHSLYQEQKHCSLYHEEESSTLYHGEPNTSFAVVNHLIQSDVPSSRPLQDIQDIVPHYLVEHFVSMTYPSQAQNTDNEITHHCAFSIPAVALTLGRNNWHLIKPAYEALASDVQWKVRRTVAASIHELAVILGEELAGSDLVPVFNGFIKDLDEVRIGALKHLADFLKLLRPTDRNILLHRLSDFILTDNECNWRFRSELAEQLFHSLALFLPADTHEYITPLAISLLMDKVAAVRKKALCLVTELVRHVSSEVNLVRNLLAELAEQYAHNRHWIRRQTFALLCSQLMSQHVLKDEHFASDVFPHLLDLSWDPVPNVRLSVAQTLACDIAVQSYFVSCESPHNEMLLQCIARLQSDTDMDVRYFASLYKIPDSTSNLDLSPDDQ